MLTRCALSIHLVGERYGAVPDGPSTKSVVVPQTQQAFIDALHKDAQAQSGADLIAGDIDELRAAIHSTLRKIEQPEPTQPDRSEGAKLVHLLCDERDRKVALQRHHCLIHDRRHHNHLSRSRATPRSSRRFRFAAKGGINRRDRV